MLDGLELPSGLANRDLWERIADVVQQCDGLRMVVQHTPSHLQASLWESPFEDWLKRWNDHADRLAVLTNMNSAEAFVDQFRQAEQHFEQMATAQQALQAIYIAIAASEAQRQQMVNDEDNAEEDLYWVLPQDSQLVPPSLAEALPLSGVAGIAQFCGDLPRSFVHEVATFVIEQDADASSASPVSALEAVFMLLRLRGFDFPATDPVTGRWVAAETVPFRPPCLTVAVQLRLVRQVLRGIAKACSGADFIVTDISLVSLGVHFPLLGLRFGCGSALLQQARNDVFTFANRRPLRVAADLARPFRG